MTDTLYGVAILLNFAVMGLACYGLYYSLTQA